MLVQVESSDAIVEATGTDDPELAQRLINQVYETLPETAGPRPGSGPLDKSARAGRGLLSIRQ